MGGIFISYRREDSAGWTGRLSEQLTERFGAESIFMDIDTIEPGVDFTEALQKAVSSCDILLAVIGPEWATSTDKSGKLRLEDPHDWVRVEIAAALKRKIRIVPVLVGGAAVPTMDFLPEELDPLAHRQVHEPTDKRWNYDVEQLIRTFPTSLRKPWLFPNLQLWRSTPVMIALLLFTVMVGVWAVYTSLYVPLPNEQNTAESVLPDLQVDGSSQDTLSPRDILVRPDPSNIRPVQGTLAVGGPSGATPISHFDMALRMGQEARLKDHVTSCIFKVLSARMERSRPDLFTLQMIVRVTNEGSFTTNFGDGNFRLLVDGIPRAPTSNLNDLVDSHSAKEGTIVFAVPVDATRLVLQVLMGEEMATFPL